MKEKKFMRNVFILLIVMYIFCFIFNFFCLLKVLVSVIY